MKRMKKHCGKGKGNWSENFSRIILHQTNVVMNLETVLYDIKPHNIIYYIYEATQLHSLHTFRLSAPTNIFTFNRCAYST